MVGHVLRRDDDGVLRVALDLEVSGRGKRGPPRRIWGASGGERDDWFGEGGALGRDRWRDGVRAIAEGIGDSGHLG